MQTKNDMKYFSLSVLFTISLLTVSAQEQTCLSMTPSQVEAAFIKQNLELIAEKMNVSIADAAIVQAKLWDNPSISFNGVNFWSTQSQRDGETIPPVFGSFAKNTQFSVELSQMISVSGRRAKLVGLEKVSREMALIQFEQLLKGLKLELRKSIADIQFQQAYRSILLKQKTLLENLIISYQKQYENGDISQNDLVRLQASLMELDDTANSIQKDMNATQKSLKNILSISNISHINIVDEDTNLPSPSTLSLGVLFEKATEGRSDVNLQRLQSKYFQKSIRYEKALRIPDLNLNVGYDRRGGVWNDFIGFGIGFDIPLFNRNQGAIKAAKASLKQSEYMVNQQEIVARNEVAEVYDNYVQTYQFYEKNHQNPIVAQLDEMLNNYTKNLLARNISMVEYMDFMDTYHNTKLMLLNTRKDVVSQLEELKYTVGTELF